MQALVDPLRAPARSGGIWFELGMLGLCRIGDINFMLFVSISLALGSQLKVVWCNMGL